MNALMTVPFHGVNLQLVDHEGQPYVPMRPMVEGMGIDWSYQSRKLNASKRRYGVAVIATPSAGGEQESICIPLRKLPGWLGTLEPARMKNPESRKKIEEFQDECDDALWQYWNDGHAVNPRAMPPPANDSAVEFGKLALAHLPNLGDTSKQALLSHISELAFGQRLIPLPKVEEHLMLAGEVGALLGVSANRIGKLANQNEMKTEQYGEFRLDKSRYSSKQVETFHYNQAAVERLRKML
ncbi:MULTISPECIES: phage antirepressor N-terminal domain-containing protein [unclassified Pseudomonas]|uniref:phage antirepressor N-terminal domain-containing protein n=1 Tax=unclassified Pseudomonas TaxID=196821 RepID=UPI0015A2D85E|nr:MULTISPECIES: phage antirepressor N-terminal domain-containing protein [unclassified Pseudomonas]NWC92618.1 phage antirepressor N-terminal domain-containing protein [Pseudomonas sp. IPO3779]NWD15615.1 phage antirepressor N-terminal domain-containing protein [Pseudomonas sp. IPO3778]